jgi:hypothetical protein
MINCFNAVNSGRNLPKIAAAAKRRLIWQEMVLTRQYFELTAF